MESRAKIFGHPIHQTLIVFPLGLLATAVIFDVLYLLTDIGTMTDVAYWLIIAGLVGGAVAAPFGSIDWLAIPKHTRARSVGLLHGLGNLVVLALFLGSLLLRGDLLEPPGTLAYALSFAGAGLAVMTAWLGGELVSRMGIGVYDDANVNAPSSLKTR